MNSNGRLIRTRVPEANESFLGYIVRLAERNFYDSPSWVLRLGELDPAQLTKESDLTFESSKRLSGLAQLTGVSATELAQITYRVAASTNLEPFYLFFDQSVPQYVIRLKHPKICPECLAEAPYCRRIWDLSIVTTCPVHQRLLIDGCPKCKRAITWARNSVSVCRCEFDWRESPKLPVDELEVGLALHVYRLCSLSTGGGFLPRLKENDPVMKLTLQDLLSALFFIAGQYQGISSATSKHLLPRGENKDFHALFTKAYSVFQNWPKHYHQFLDWRRNQKRNIPYTQQRLKSALYRDFGKFYTGLYRMLSGSQFDFMRSAFDEYLVNNWENDYVSDESRSEDATLGYVGRYISKTDAKRLLGTDNSTINRLIEKCTLTTKVRSKGKKRLIFIELGGLAKLKREFNQPFNLEL